MPSRHLLIRCFAVLAILASAVAAQDNAADAAKLIAVLQIAPGATVAEIGAGGGELTLALARHVGPAGRVYTSELGDDRVQRLQQAVGKSGLTNIEIVAGRETVANLPDGCCDAIFMRSVYHHFGDPASMNASFLRALKPGARIAVIDFAPPGVTAAAGRRGEDGQHGVSAEMAAGELKAAGFQVVVTEERAQRGFMVVAVKPKA